MEGRLDVLVRDAGADPDHLRRDLCLRDDDGTLQVRVDRTAWGTILAGEETGDGSLLEIIDPLGTTGVTFDRLNLTFTSVRIATLNDLNAEWTGGFFDASGNRFFVSVQHNVTGHGVVLELTGWR